MFLYGQTQSYGPGSTNESLFVHVARINGPLPDYHPQMLLQCLLWGAHFSLTLTMSIIHPSCREDIISQTNYHLPWAGHKRRENLLLAAVCCRRLPARGRITFCESIPSSRVRRCYLYSPQDQETHKMRGFVVWISRAIGSVSTSYLYMILYLTLSQCRCGFLQIPGGIPDRAVGSTATSSSLA
jgi:hypothetical protein